MPLPTRPVDAAEIATDWGQAIHDYTFAPAGCEVHSSTTVNCGTTPLKLHCDTVDDDPGGYVDTANDQIEVPTGGEGLYLVFARGNSVNGSAADGYQTRCMIYLNGAQVSNGIEDNAAGTNVAVPVTWVGILAAGDILSFYGQRRGGGTSPDVSMADIVVLRVGAEFGTA